ncbi:MAG: hypothetical protein DRI84_04060 [Bacteroidetes bacterium]|nr:MAG: hypothetical protein DRI84_04060 [Bacteroidota bacterium]
MNSIIQLFLRAKHWQLFVIGFVPFVIFYINVLSNLLSRDFMQISHDSTFVIESYRYLGPLMILLAIVNYGWIWAVGAGLQEKVPPYVPMKARKFKWFIGIPFFYFIALAFLMSFLLMSLLPDLLNGDIIPNLSLIFGSLAVIIPLHLFSIFAIFYSMYFAAKTIKSVELQREARFEDFIGEFFLIWFFPIGVWILQPRINKMLNSTEVFHKRSL